jgi:hypothetical protein
VFSATLTRNRARAGVGHWRSVSARSVSGSSLIKLVLGKWFVQTVATVWRNLVEKAASEASPTCMGDSCADTGWNLTVGV